VRVDRESRTIWLRQSGLEEYLLCPERARRKWFEGLEDPTNDAAATGTAMHAAIEGQLKLRRDLGESFTTWVMIDIAKAKFDELHNAGIKYVKADYATAMQFIETGIPAWRAYIEPYVVVDEHLKLEWEFDVPLMTWRARRPYVSTADKWDIRLTGTSDCIDIRRIYDWKTWGQTKKQWELQRKSVQATVYAHAAAHEGLLEWPIDFSFAAIKKLKTKEFAELIPVKRTESHVDWLCQQIHGLLTLWDSVGEEGPWPLVDTHSLCSDKWCPAWAQCKGALVSNQNFLWKP
jgi:hypothetical protein